jgi:hypothetical protein
MIALVLIPRESQPVDCFAQVECLVEWCWRDRIQGLRMADPGGQEHRRLSRSWDRNARLAVIPRCTAYSSSEAPTLSIPTKYGDALFLVFN